MKTQIKNIILATFITGVLASCAKENMVVEKNNDLKWSIDKKIENDDIRLRIGYNPNETYIVSDTKKEFFVESFGILSLQQAELKDRVKVVLTQPVEKDIKVVLTYDPSLYQEIKTSYVGYELAGQEVLNYQKELVIKAGETESAFELALGVSTEVKRLLLPYRVRIEGDDTIKFLGNKADVLAVLVSPKDVSGKIRLEVNPLENSCDELKQTFQACQERHKQVRKGETLPPRILFGDLGGWYGKGMFFYSRVEKFDYERVVSYEIEASVDKKDQFEIKNGNPGLSFRRSYSHLQPIPDLFEAYSPYNIEKLETGEFKLTSTVDEDFWFTFTKL